MKVHQDDFDNTIGRLDRVLSKMVIWGKEKDLDQPNKQTLKHHAEDMVAAGQKILKDLGQAVEGTPQPSIQYERDQNVKTSQSDCDPKSIRFRAG